jgi:hypothetical protein
MSLIDAIVNRSFRDSPSGRVVVFSGEPGKQGYLLRSPTEEQKIRSFLKMFYFAHLYILVIGLMLSQAWASWLTQALLERPARHMLGAVSITLAIYGLVVGLPYALLWRAYKRALTCFIVPEDAVSLTGTTAPAGRQWVALAVAGFALLILAAILLLAIRPRAP